MNEKKRKFAEGALRRASYKWGPRYTAKINARVARGQYKCAKCKGIFRDKQTQMDHVFPVVDPNEGKSTLDVFADRLLADLEGWQCLCIPCHQGKSIDENEIRRESRKKVDISDEKE